MATVSTITANGVTYDINNGIITVTDTISSFPKTIYDNDIKSDMVVLESYFNNGGALQSAVSWTTANGSITLNGSISGTTTVKLILGKSF